jgi:hypothetical protein
VARPGLAARVAARRDQRGRRDLEDFAGAAARLASARPWIALLGFIPALQATHTLLERACRAALLVSPDDAPPGAGITRALFEDVDFLRATLLLFAADGDVLEGNIHDAEIRARDNARVVRQSRWQYLRARHAVLDAELAMRRARIS